jgi:hypothetical protein
MYFPFVLHIVGIDKIYDSPRYNIKLTQYVLMLTYCIFSSNKMLVSSSSRTLQIRESIILYTMHKQKQPREEMIVEDRRES